MNDILNSFIDFLANPYVGAIMCGICLILILLIVILRMDIRKHKQLHRDRSQEGEAYEKKVSVYERRNKDLEDRNALLEGKVDELRRTKEMISRIAYTDEMTGLPNRIALNDVLEGIMLSLSDKEQIGIILFDIRNYRRINQTVGYSGGDELMIDIAHRVQSVLQEKDYLARYGADKFAIISQMLINDNGFEEKLNGIISAFETPFKIMARECNVEISMGVVMVPQDGNEARLLLKKAETALGEARRMGKNAYQLFTEDILSDMNRRLELQVDIRRAVDEKQFFFDYKPQYSLPDGKLMGMKALLRWKHQEKGILMPDLFLQTASEMGCIIEISEYTMRTAFEQLKYWQSMGQTDIKLIIELSEREFSDKLLADRIKGIINEAGVNPINVELEISEGVILKNLYSAGERINALRNIGLGVSMIRFGEMNSGWACIKELYVNSFKFDKSFIEKMVKDSSDRKLFETMKDIFSSSGTYIMEECNADTDSDAYHWDMGKDINQGYYYGEILAAEETEKLFGEQT